MKKSLKKILFLIILMIDKCEFGKGVVSDIEGVDSIEALINAPGTAKIIESVAREIIKATFWRDSEEKESTGAVLSAV